MALEGERRNEVDSTRHLDGLHHHTTHKHHQKTSNWKATSIDQVHNFWIKHLTALHSALTQDTNETIRHPETAPTWLTTGATTLIHKNRLTNNAKNYCPTYYKIITLMLTDKIYNHLTTTKILPTEQKGIMQGARGCKDHLMLDKTITDDAKKNKKPKHNVDQLQKSIQQCPAQMDPRMPQHINNRHTNTTFHTNNDQTMANKNKLTNAQRHHPNRHHQLQTRNFPRQFPLTTPILPCPHPHHQSPQAKQRRLQDQERKNTHPDVH